MSTICSSRSITSNSRVGFCECGVFSRVLVLLTLLAFGRREKISEPGPRMKDRSCEANPLDDPDLDEAAPLDEHITSLKRKYIEQKAQLEKTGRDTTQERDRLLLETQSKSHEIAQQQDANRALEARIEALRGEHQEELKGVLQESADQQHEIELRDRSIKVLVCDGLTFEKLTLSDQDLTSGNEDLTAQRAQLNERVASLSANVTQARAQLKEAMEGRASQARMLSCCSYIYHVTYSICYTPPRSR
jgi:hypothetical protein